MACHIMDPVYWALNLKYPISVSGNSTISNLYSPPQAQKVTYKFPARETVNGIKMPEVAVHWYDGGLIPDRPVELKDGEMMGDRGGGIIFVGSRGKIMTGTYGMNPTLLPKTEMKFFKEPEPWIPRIEGGSGDIWKSKAHEQDWIRACKESPDNRVESTSNFQFSGPFNEMVVMGVLAVRLQSLNQELEWDGENMRFTNIPADANIRTIIEDGFKITDGHPTFKKTWTEPVNATEYANELIKHTYKNGWKLPEMPK
jgi:hypothetical protein